MMVLNHGKKSRKLTQKTLLLLLLTLPL